MSPTSAVTATGRIAGRHGDALLLFEVQHRADGVRPQPQQCPAAGIAPRLWSRASATHCDIRAPHLQNRPTRGLNQRVALRSDGAYTQFSPYIQLYACPVRSVDHGPRIGSGDGQHLPPVNPGNFGIACIRRQICPTYAVSGLVHTICLPATAAASGHGPCRVIGHAQVDHIHLRQRQQGMIIGKLLRDIVPGGIGAGTGFRLRGDGHNPRRCPADLCVTTGTGLGQKPAPIMPIPTVSVIAACQWF